MVKIPPFANPAAATAEKPKKKVRFWDTWQALLLFVALLLTARYWVFEPFKIPSGSMEPTLIGHEDYGDRIVTNKLAYWGAEPQRFDVFVFRHDDSWEGSPQHSLKNYIKRVAGLPGETIVISGGDLFLADPATGAEKIIRKWEYGEALQEDLWQPVSRATFRIQTPAADAGDLRRKIVEQENRRAFAWDIGKDEKSTARFGSPGRALYLEGPATLTYPYPVTNVYVKMGRWPFRHFGCPMAHLPELGAEGAPKVRDPREKSENSRPYLANSWSGVRCPNCGQLRYPLGRDEAAEPRILADPTWGPTGENATARGDGEGNGAPGALFFYGGYDTVGDLKVELELEVLQPGGALEVVVGSDLHRAAWGLSLGGELPARAAEEGRHEVAEHPRLEPGRKHTILLAYVDGTVMAALDGRKLDRLTPDVAPQGAAQIKSVAQVRFSGPVQVRLTRLDLYRDLYYTLCMDHDRGKLDPISRESKDATRRAYLANEGRFRAEIPKDCYLALGDNSPSSKDSRVWGFVPRENLVGRASFTWWPPSRWRIIH